MQLPTLATNTTNTNWWIFPSLLQMVNIPPSPPSRSGSFAGWSDCLFACLVCLLFLSVYLSVYFPLVLSLSSAKMYTLLHSTSILIQICSLERPTKQKKQKKYDPWNIHSLSEKARQRMLARQTDFLWAPCFLPVQGIAFTLRVTTTCIYYICTCSQCQFVLWPLCPQSTLLECCLMVGKSG